MAPMGVGVIVGFSLTGVGKPDKYFTGRALGIA